VRFYNYSFICFSCFSHACYIFCSSHPSRFNHPNNLLWRQTEALHYIILSIPLFIFQIQVYPQHFVLRHSQWMFYWNHKKRVSHQYRTKGKIMFLCVLIFRFLGREKDKVCEYNL
jgi:hypothetical protein